MNDECITRDVFVVGSSAGGLEALVTILGLLTPDLPAVIGVVLHRNPMAESHMVHILNRRSALPVGEPADGDPFEAGRVYVAPRDRHLTIESTCWRLHRGAKRHRMRPGVDPLFESAAKAYGARAVGIVCSGSGSDGLTGCIAIKAAGGLTIAQLPEEARAPWMPRHAIEKDDVDAVLGRGGNCRGHPDPRPRGTDRPGRRQVTMAREAAGLPQAAPETALDAGQVIHRAERCSRLPMNPADEIVDVVDEDDRVVATATRLEVRRRRLLHRCTYVLLENAAGEILVHRRTDTKDVFPGAYDVFAGGVCGAGESYHECARREVAEELGVEGADLQSLFKHRYRGADGQAWGAVYEGRWDGPVRPQESEVAWQAWVTPGQLERMLAELTFCPDSREVFERLRARPA